MARQETNEQWLFRVDEGVDPEESALETWLKSMEGSPDSTWNIYVRGLRLNCTRYGVTPQQLFEQRVREIQRKTSARDYLVKGQIKRRAVRLMEELQHDKRDGWPAELEDFVLPGAKAPSTCNMVSKALTSFFSAFGDELAMRFGRNEKASGDSEGSDSITPTMIREALSFTGDEFPLRNRAVALFLKDSGIRSSDLGLITVGDFRNALSKRRLSHTGEAFALFDPLTTQKEKIPANILIGPEAIEAAEKYLEVMRPGASDGNALFTMRPSKRGDLREREEYVAISAAAAGGVVKRMIDRALGAEASTRTTHSLRNFHYNALVYAGVPKDGVKWLQGKKQDTYHRGNGMAEEIISGYMKAYNSKLIVLSEPSPTEEEYKAKIREEVREEVEMEIKHNMSQARLDYERKLAGIRDEVQKMVREELARLREPLE